MTTKEEALFEATYTLCKMSYQEVGITKLSDELITVMLKNLKEMSGAEQGLIGMFVMGYYNALTGNLDLPEPTDEELLAGVLAVHEQRN